MPLQLNPPSKAVIDTPQQAAFYSTATTPGSFALRARAGTGKTHCLRGWTSKARGSGVCTSFSRSTVAELAKKLPYAFPAKSLHAFGRQAIASSGTFSDVDNGKIYELTKEYFSTHESADKTLWSAAMKLVSLAKTFGLAPYNERTLVPDTPAAWEDLADQFDIDFTPELHEIAHEVLCASNQIALKDGLIDFDDMLYISLLWNHRFPKYPTIIADEVQDFNTLQHLMLARLLRPGGRLIAAGDDRQAIYAFRGALSDSYNALVSKFSMTEMPLTVSFRCPRAVVREAQFYVPDIEPAPNAIEGEVIVHDAQHPLHLPTVPSTVLCRNNAPLVRLALRLLVAGRTAEVAGVEIGKGLISLTKRITKRNLDSKEFLDRLDAWGRREIKRKPESRARVHDKIAALTALAHVHPKLKDIQNHLDKLYPNPKDRNYRPAEVHLSTIHKAKGREWPDVLLLDPQLMPSPYAEAEWERTQESNLAYVAITRAQQTLHYCTSDLIF